MSSVLFFDKPGGYPRGWTDLFAAQSFPAVWERDKEELDGGKPSIKGMLKRLGVESAATASTPQKGKDMEVAI